MGYPIKNKLFLIYIFSALSLLFLTWQGCEKSSTKPSIEPIDNNEPDTTEFLFEWTIDTLGSPNYFSRLVDVHINNENDILAVGEIIDDFTDSTKYNLVHWDGTTWNKVNVKRLTSAGNISSPNEIQAIKHIRGDEYYIATGSVYKWDGGIAQPSFIRNGWTPELFWEIEKIDSVYYAHGIYGALAHNTGSGWERIITNTTTRISGMCEGLDENGNKVIYATVASEDFRAEDPQSRVIKIAGNNLIDMSSDGLPRWISSIWQTKDSGYFVAGAGLFNATTISDTTQWQQLTDGIDTAFLTSFALNSENDVFIAGDRGVIIHYNGSNWCSLKAIQFPDMPFSTLYNVEVQGDLVVAVGRNINPSGRTQAIILRGKRLNQ